MAAAGQGKAQQRPAFQLTEDELLSARSDAALRRGTLIFNEHSAMAQRDAFREILPEDVEACGGREGFLEVFREFYRRIMADPRLGVLFDRSHPDTDVPPEEHGTRLGLWYLGRYGRPPDQEYLALRGALGGLFGGIGRSHRRAQACPARPSEQQGLGFTVTQRNTWLGYQQQAIEERRVPPEVAEKLIKLHARHAMGAYGPFADVG